MFVEGSLLWTAEKRPSKEGPLDLRAFIQLHVETGKALLRARNNGAAQNNPAAGSVDYAKFKDRKNRISFRAPHLEELLDTARERLMEQRMMVDVKGPLNVVGDIHGQFADLWRIITIGNIPPKSKYLFLGDYVDRGSHSLECIFMLLALFVKFPGTVTLLRGNHECVHVNSAYGFLDECKRRLSTNIFKQFQDVFNCMPLVARIQRKILCMHGGISEAMHSFEDILSIERPTFAQAPDGIVADILWSDPDPDQPGWKEGGRGTGCLFGETALKDFLKRLDLQMIIRAHQVIQDGYQFFGKGTLITVFSAPNYCNEFNNNGAFLQISRQLKVTVKQLRAKDGVGNKIQGQNFAN